jgi:hypothetical protein
VSARPPRVRLRQAVLAAAELEPVEEQLRSALGLLEPFHDPGVGMFGLENAVFALGDCFLEIVSPAQADTAAGRYMERHGGDCGYMIMFDLEDLDAARERAQRAGVRTVWQIDLPDISGTHLHPADMRGAIVSIDSSRPYGSWRWGGPQWTERTARGAPGRLVAASIAVADPGAVAARWADVLGVDLEPGAEPVIRLEDAAVSFTSASHQRSEGLSELTLELPAQVRQGRELEQVGGVALHLRDGAAGS